MRLFWAIVLLVAATAASAAEKPVPRQELERDVERYAALLAKDGNNARYLNALGFAYYRLLRFDEAMEAYRKATAADPAYAIAFNNLGALYLNVHSYPDAEAAFKQAVALDPAYVKAAYNLAIAQYRQGKYLEAYESYRKAKKLDAGYFKQRLTDPDSREKIEQEITQHKGDQERLRRLLKELDAER